MILIHAKAVAQQSKPSVVVTAAPKENIVAVKIAAQQITFVEMGYPVVSSQVTSTQGHRRLRRRLTIAFLAGNHVAPSVARQAHIAVTITLKPERTAGRRAGLDCLQRFTGVTLD